jgi:hypothetical protein
MVRKMNKDDQNSKHAVDERYGVKVYQSTGDMLYKTDRRHGLHHGGEQLAFPALA